MPDQDPSIYEGDPRFTAGLIADVFNVLEKHGYQRPTGVTGRAIADLLRLVETFEGKADE